MPHYNTSPNISDKTKAKIDISVYSKSVLQGLESGKHDNSTTRELIKTINCLIAEHDVKLMVNLDENTKAAKKSTCINDKNDSSDKSNSL